MEETQEKERCMKEAQQKQERKLAAEHRICLSVIMGVYNQKDRMVLEQAVDSVLCQTFTEFEFLIYDDGSDKEEARFLMELSKKDARIRLLRGEENKGLAHALNECLKVAKGEFIARMDGDDCSAPERFHKQLEFLHGHAEAAFVGSAAQLFDENGVWGVRKLPALPGEKEFLRFSPYIHPSVMFRSDVLKEAGGYREIKDTLRCEDYELFMRLHCMGHRGWNMPEVLFCYREDRNRYDKRIFAQRIAEMKIRYRGFKAMGILNIWNMVYVLKPVVMVLIPKWLRRKHRTSYKSADNSRMPEQEGRRMEQELTGQEASAREIYNSIFAPVLLEFVEWVLEEAQKRGIRRLYFLARDGYQMHLAAEYLCKKRGVPLDCRYLYGSRYAWRIPQFSLMGEECLELICRGGIDVTFEKVVKRGGLTEEEAKAVAEELGFADDYRRVLSYSEVMGLKKPLAKSRLFLPFVNAHSQEAYETTIGYFRQEGLFDDVEYALVDSGWTGSLQQTLQQLLNCAGYPKKQEGFYFGLYELPEDATKEKYQAYYFGPEQGIKRKVYFSNCLYEAVYSAPHGMTVGYEEYRAPHGMTVGYEEYRAKNNLEAEGVESSPETLYKEEEEKDWKKIYCPVFYKEKNLNQTLMEQEVRWLKEYLEEYQKEHTDRRPEKSGCILQVTVQSSKQKMEIGKSSSTGQTYRLLKRFMGSPSREDVEAYGSLLFSDDVTEEQVQPVAAKLSKEEIRNQQLWNKLLIMLGVKKQVLKESAWIEGSIALAGGYASWQRLHARCYKYLVYFRKWMKKGRKH